MPNDQQQLSAIDRFKRERDAMLHAQREFADASRRQQAANENQRNEVIREARLRHQRQTRIEQTKIDALLKRRAEEARQQREREQRKLDEACQREREELNERNQQRSKQAAAEVRMRFEPQWKRLRSHHQQEEKKFHEDEKSHLGRFRNAMRTVTLRSIMYGENRSAVLSGLFRSFASKDVRLEDFERTQRKEVHALRAKEERAKSQASKQTREDVDHTNAAQREQHKARQQELAAAHQREEADFRRAWEARGQERDRAYQQPVAERETQPKSRSENSGIHREESRDQEGRTADPRRRPGRGDDFGRGR